MLNDPRQRSIFDLFQGADVQPERDNERLSSQLDLIREYMADGVWRTLNELLAYLKQRLLGEGE